MNQFDQSCTPQNLVVYIMGDEAYMRNVSERMLETIKEMGAFQRLIGDDPVWMFKCADEDGLIKTLLELNRLGFLFTGGVPGYPASDMFEFLLERKKLSANFKAIRWRGPGDWYIIERRVPLLK